MVLANAVTGVPEASYEHGPFGEVIHMSGVEAENNPIRFSTKYEDETELSYFGFRYYNLSHGRWLNRDPLGELDGPNPYAMLRNNSVNNTDVLGLFDASLPFDEYDISVAAGLGILKTAQLKLLPLAPRRGEIRRAEIKASLRASVGLGLEVKINKLGYEFNLSQSTVNIMPVTPYPRITRSQGQVVIWVILITPSRVSS